MRALRLGTGSSPGGLGLLTGGPSAGTVREERGSSSVREAMALSSVDSVAVDEGAEEIASASAAGASRGRKRSVRIVEAVFGPSRPQNSIRTTIREVRETINVFGSEYYCWEGKNTK